MMLSPESERHPGLDAGAMPERAARDYTGQSRLFLLRLWPEDDLLEASGPGSVEEDTALRWCGKVQLVGGEARAFSGWDALIGFLELMMSQGPRSGR